MNSYPVFIDRSPPGFLEALRNRIEKVLSESFWYPSEFAPEEFTSPNVHVQNLPVSKTESKERLKSKDYPIVVVEWIDHAVSDFEPTAMGYEITVAISFGCYWNDIDNQGWTIPVRMMRAVEIDLCDNKVLEGYILQSYKGKPGNTQEPPYYTAGLETKWAGAPPAVEVPTEDDFIREEDNEKIPVAQNESGEGINQGGL